MSGAVLTPDNPRGLRDLPFRVVEATPAEKARARAIYDALEAQYPDAECALRFRTPLELLIATMLSAQSTDVGVNKATPALFEAFPSAQDYADAEPEDLHPYIRTIGLYRNKAKAIVSAMRTISDEYGGEVPDTMDDLLRLRGVARKTANVVLGNAFGKNMGVVVDTHVERLSKRFSLVPEDAAAPAIEKALCGLFARRRWTQLPHLMIAHGRKVCKARGWLCEDDPVCRRFCINARRGSGRTRKPQRRTATRGAS